MDNLPKNECTFLKACLWELIWPGARLIMLGFNWNLLYECSRNKGGKSPFCMNSCLPMYEGEVGLAIDTSTHVKLYVELGSTTSISHVAQNTCSQVSGEHFCKTLHGCLIQNEEDLENASV